MQSESARNVVFTIALLGLLVLVGPLIMSRPASSEPVPSLPAIPAIDNGTVGDHSVPVIVDLLRSATPTATMDLTPPATPTATPTPTPTPRPAPQIRISDNSIGNPWLYLWDQPSGRLFEGPNTTGRPMIFFNMTGDEWRIHRGANVTGEILFTVDPVTGRIWAGPNTTGPLLYTLQTVPFDRGPVVRVHEGNEKGYVIYTINDDDMYDGPNVTGPLVYHGSDPFRGPVQFLLPLLADRRIP